MNYIMCDTHHCLPKDHILIPEAVEVGGSLFFGRSPISKQWLLARGVLLALSSIILIWSITYHVLHHNLLEWIYWINNWSLLLSSIYLLLSFIVTFKIYTFVEQQQSQLCSAPSSNSPYNSKDQSKMMDETVSFAMKSPAIQKYKSIAQMEEDSHNEPSLGIRIEQHEPIEPLQHPPDIDDDNISTVSTDSSASSYSFKLHNDSDASYHSFKIDDNDKTNHLHIKMDELPAPTYFNGNSVVFWLFTLKRMKMTALSTMHKKFLQTVMALNMVSVIIYVAFLYEYDVDEIWNIMTTHHKSQVLFSFLVNSGFLQSIIMFFEYYSSALTMTYEGVIYPVFIGVSYCIMSIAISVSQFDVEYNKQYRNANQMEMDHVFNVSIGKLYLFVCCDWIHSPLHSLIHISSVLFLLILFHFLFTFTKKFILSHIWSFYYTHKNEEEQAFCEDMYREAMQINSYDSYAMNIINDGNGIQIIHKTEICDVNMNNIAESNILLDASVSGQSGVSPSSVVDLQYENYHNNSKANHLAIAEPEDHVANAVIGDDDEYEEYCYYDQREGDMDHHNDVPRLI
eukprot:704689_1